MRIQELYLRFCQTLRNFGSARAGNVAITFAFASISLIGGVGAAVDYSRANSVKAAMQNALDATALMLAKEAANVTASQLQTDATNFFLSQFTRPEAKNAKVTVIANADATTIQVNGSATMDTLIAQIIGVKTINIGDTATVTWGAQASLRVALVLDNTGSMAQSGKMPALQTATKNLLAKLKSASLNNGDVYVSIVPFVKDVNLGASNYNQSWLLWDDGTDNSWDGANGTCSKSGYSPRSKCNAQGSCSISGYTTDASCTAAGSCSLSGYSSQSSCTAATACSISGYTSQSSCTNAGACSNPGQTTKTSCTGTNACSKSQYTTRNSCTSKGGIWGRGTWTAGVWNVGTWTAGVWTGPTWTPKSHSTWNGCVVDRGDWSGPSSGNYDTNIVAPTTGVPATRYAPENYSSCPQAAMAMSYNWTAMNSLVNSMSPNGNTNQSIGLQLGWMSLTTNAPLPAPAMSSGVKYAQHIVLLTDGLNTEDRWYSDQASIDARQAILCKNIKAAGVTLWTIQVNTGGDPTSTLLQKCASDPSKFFLLTTASEIISTFDDISFQITQLHLAK
jgi:Flp pilus assembly protein TadG